MYFDCDGGYRNLHGMKLYRGKLYTVQVKLGEIRVRWMECINANILVVILYHNLARSYRKMRLEKGMWDLSGLFLTVVYESTMISIKISVKKDI